MEKIQQINIVCHQGISQTVVGKHGVKKIIDKTLEYESSVLSKFDVFGEDDILLKQIINCPVEITYKTEDNF